MKKVVAITITVFLLSNGSAVWAEILPALTVSDPAPGYGVSGNNRTAGWEFTVTDDIAVVGLGIFDFEEDPMYAPGLIWPHEIGIWNDGELVYSTTVPPGTEDTVFLDDFRYIETDSFWLSEGETYVIGTTEFGDPFIGNSSSASITTLDSIIYGRTLMSPSDSGFSLPTLDRDYYFCGPNFLVIPEPTTLALLGSGIILIRQKHNKKKTR